MCRSQTALSINVNLVNNKELLLPDLLAFLRVNLTKHRQALAKNPPAKANLARQQPQSNNTGAAKTTGLLLRSNRVVYRIYLTLIGSAMIGLNARNVH